jgi:hypothetical protein
MKFKIKTIIFLLVLISNTGLSQVESCYFKDTTSLIAVIESRIVKSGHSEWYREAVYIRVPKNFLFEGENNIIDFIMNNTNNDFIVNNYDTLDTNDLVNIYDVLPLGLKETDNRLKISFFKLNILYVKSIPGVQFTFGDSIEYKEYPIRLEEVFVNKKEKPERILEIKTPYITDNISFEQTDFWEYVRDRRYFRKSYQCN